MINKFFKFVFVLFVFSFFMASVQSRAEFEAQPLYVPTKLSDLAKGYWAFGKLDTKNDALIDQYLMITECSLYAQFYKDDFEWSKIREATRKYVEDNKANFPRRFEFVQPIALDRYDFNLGGFALLKQYQIVGLSKLVISGNSQDEYPCIKSDKYNPQQFPMNAILNMERPLSYTFVKADKALAEEYLKYITDNKIRTEYGRPAYIRYRFKVEQSIGTSILDQSVLSNFYGSLESIAIFGDKEMLIKLDEQKF